MSAAAPLPDAARKIMPGLLATKLYAPSPRADLVLRPRLTALLDAGRATRLILLSAPAGSGKTTLLAASLCQAGRRAGWLALDSADNDLARFLAYLSAAAAAALPEDMAGAAGELQSRLRAAEAPAAEAVLTDLINLIAPLPGDLILVLDDYHVITAPAVHGAVASLLDHLPPNLHLVIATRADPPLPLPRLRSRGQLVEIRAGDLRFTPAEAAAFLNGTMGLALSPDQAAALDERTEGWIAGLQLAALSMAGRDDVEGFIRAFTGSNRFILDFLMEEVLGREPETVQRFLLYTAVLNPFCAALCDAVTGRTDSGQMIDRLERRNLFVVPLDDGRCWYRYHHLFADLLQARLHQLEPGQAAVLQSRAAVWCEQAGQPAEAIGYALAAKEYTRAGDLIADCWGPLSNTGRIETVWTWLTALPPAIVAANAALSVACCWVLWLRGQPQLMEPHLLDAERALNKTVGCAPADPAPADQAARAPLQAQVATLHAIVARYRGEFAAAIAQAERARTLVSEDLGPEVDPLLHAQLRALAALALASACDGAGDLPRAADAYAESVHWSQEGRNAAGVAVTYRLASVLRLLGRLDAAEEACRAALRFLEEQQMARLSPAGVLHLALAEVLLERNEQAAAADQLARGSDLGRRSGRMDAVRNAAPALVRLRLGRGDTTGALAAVGAAFAALGDSPSPLAEAELLALRARALACAGSPAEAAACIAEAQRLTAHERGLTREMVTLAAVRVWPAAEHAAHLTQLAENLAAAEARGWFGALIELRIVRGLLLARLGDVRGAEADMQAALALAAPRGYVRVFLDEGPPLAELLRGLAARGQTRPRDGALAALLTTFDAAGDLAVGRRSAQGAPLPPADGPRTGASRAAVQPLIEGLSERELEVLRLLAAGLTNEQIAQRLVIALGTVKAHIHHIAGKLGAQNRAHAVARAQELGLL